MADGELTVKLELTLSEPALRHLRERAERLGVSLDTAAAEVIEQALFDHHDYDWGADLENDPRAPMPPFDPNEPTVSLEEAMAMFDGELEKRLAAKR